MKSHHELRFFVRPEKALRIRDFVREYMDFDEYCVGKSDFSYAVHTVYLDSDDWLYWRTIRNKLAFTTSASVLVSLLLGLGTATIIFFNGKTNLGKGEVPLGTNVATAQPQTGMELKKEEAGQRNADRVMLVADHAEGEATRDQTVQPQTEVELKKKEVEKNAEFRSRLVETARSDCIVAEEKLRLGQRKEAFAHLARACEYDPSSELAVEKTLNALVFLDKELPTSIVNIWTTQFTNSIGITAQFSPDGTRIVTTSSDKTVRVWNLIPERAGRPPEWFPDFLRYMGQMRLNPDGELETLKPADSLALRERLRAVQRASASADTPYLRILRKYVRE